MNYPVNELNAFLADKVMGLPGVGYYRRKSVYNTEREKCAAGDLTAFGDVAGLYYTWVANSVDSLDSLVAVPNYVEKVAEAFQLVEKLRPIFSFDIQVWSDHYVVSISGPKNKGDSHYQELVERPCDRVSVGICLAIIDLFYLGALGCPKDELPKLW